MVALHQAAAESVDDAEPFYPTSDGQPMAENTKQFDWIVTIKFNLDAICPDFVADRLRATARAASA